VNIGESVATYGTKREAKQRINELRVLSHCEAYYEVVTPNGNVS
jgi:hypothetical protein